MPRKINKILVANRGEIAIRILRAAAELGIRTVSIFTHEDRFSPHRYKSDEAYQVGEDDDPLKPYLDIDGVIEVAQLNDVDAIHPGYGFLSENVAFVTRCRDGLSNLTIRQAKEGDVKSDWSEKEKTKDSGSREIPFKTVFPSFFRIILNRYTLYPLIFLQRLFYRSDLGLTLLAIGRIPTETDNG